MDDGTISRAQGCLLGQLAGDALGSLVEFQTPVQIRRSYPDGVRKLSDGGTWDTLAGQPTDDSEMALLLARMLVNIGCYDQELALKEYQSWLSSGPFDCGTTIAAGLRGKPNTESQANGAMMRISPLGIFGSRFQLSQAAEWARQDARLTHPNPLCLQANALYVTGIAHAVASGCSPRELYLHILNQAQAQSVESLLMETLKQAADEPPADYVRQQGWVLIAFQNAWYQLLHAPNFAEGVIDTVMHGGDTDTNAAICGALLGAVSGRQAVPAQWVETLLNCRPKAGEPRVRRPRPECFWPTDVLELAERLLI
jgi:ADP-ribosyl-[dinitrogen reductase] hydrolase